LGGRGHTEGGGGYTARRRDNAELRARARRRHGEDNTERGGGDTQGGPGYTEGGAGDTEGRRGPPEARGFGYTEEGEGPPGMEGLGAPVAFGFEGFLSQAARSDASAEKDRMRSRALFALRAPRSNTEAPGPDAPAPGGAPLSSLPRSPLCPPEAAAAPPSPCSALPRSPLPLQPEAVGTAPEQPASPGFTPTHAAGPGRTPDARAQRVAPVSPLWAMAIGSAGAGW